MWSGWGPTKTLTKDHTVLPETPYGVREIQGIDRKKLRLFFLSLLWRAAATGRNEFSDVVLSTDSLEKLRLMILHESVEPLSFYPAVLTQLSTFGVIHNHTPLAKTKVVPALAGEPERRIPIFRFYFDGLIAHVHNQASDEGYTETSIA